MHSVYYECAPTSFSNTWTTQEQRHPELNLRNATDIYLPFPRIEMYKRLPIYSLPSAWNETGDFRYQRNAFTYQVALHEFLTAWQGWGNAAIITRKNPQSLRGFAVDEKNASPRYTQASWSFRSGFITSSSWWAVSMRSWHSDILLFTVASHSCSE